VSEDGRERHTMNSACLLIANDVAPGLEAEFEAWYQQEHLAERLAVPGFRTARRYRSLSASHAWLALYEVRDSAVFSSPAYRSRLENPTPRTRQIMPHFRRMARSQLTLQASDGGGLGAVLDLVVCASPSGPILAPAPLDSWKRHPAFERARFLVAPDGPVAGASSSEASLRPGRDTRFAGAWLIEWAALDSIELPDTAAGFARAGWPVEPDLGGRYRLINHRRAFDPASPE